MSEAKDIENIHLFLDENQIYFIDWVENTSSSTCA